MPDKRIPTSFAVNIYGKLEPYELNPMLSRARVRTFYKYLNRNGGFFTDEMSQYIIDRAGGSPIVGHFDTETLDFTSHMSVSQSKGYGFIPPENPNFAWELHADVDGVVREYACFDVLLWTGRYSEAKLIPTKAQSMELDPKSIDGNWELIGNGIEAFKYTSAHLSGLCVLGDEVEPCFEGAAFYSQNGLFSDYLNAMKEEIVKNFSLQLSNKEKGGKKKMPMKFDLPHESNFENLFNLMNPRYNEENEFIVDFMIHSVGEKELYAFSCKDGKNYLVSFETNEEGVITLGERQEVANTLFGLTAEAAEVFAELVGEGTIQDVKNTLDNYQNQISELTKTVEEKDLAIAEYVAADYSGKIDSMTAEIDELKSQISQYEQIQKDVLDTQKTELIDSYSNLLDAEEIASYKESKDKYTLEELEGKLAIRFSRKYRKQEDVRLPNIHSEEGTNPVLSALKSYKHKKGE